MLPGFFKTACSILGFFLYSFFSRRFVSIHVVHPLVRIDIAIDWKKYRFILSERSIFHTIDTRSIAFYVFTRCMPTALSVDEILLSRYVNLCTNFISLPTKVKMAPFLLKHMYNVLFAFTNLPMPLATCFKLCIRASYKEWCISEKR